MKNIKKNIITSVFWLMSLAITYAQSHTYVVRDFETWSQVGLKVKVNKKLSFGLSESLRLDHNSTEHNQLFTNLYGGYKFNKYVSLKTGFRAINQSEDEGTKTNHLRYFLSGAIKHDISRFDMKYRLMYTNKNEWGISKSEGDEPVNNLRLQVKSKYNIKNWKADPFVSTEIFRKFKDGDAEWNKFRFKMGTDVKLKSFGEIGAYYAIEKEFGTEYSPTNYIIGLNYTYTFKLY